MASTLPTPTDCCTNNDNACCADSCVTVTATAGLYPGNPNTLGILPEDTTMASDVWQTNADGSILLIRWTWNPNTQTWQ